jgi:hypothetical protein
MKSPDTKITFLDYIKSNPYSQLLTPISTIFGFSDIAKAVTRGHLPFVSVGAAAAIGLILLYNFHRLRAVRLNDSSSSKDFYPFLGSLTEEQRKPFIVPRPKDQQLISASIKRNAGVYSIISGESGAGKTTLVSLYASPPPDTEPTIFIIDDRVNTFYDLLNATLKFQQSGRDAELDELITDALAAVTPSSSRRESISDHFRLLLDYFSDRFLSESLVLIFEQSERLSANIRHFSKNEFQAALAFFEVLRTTAWIRVAFVTRNDRATDVLTLLPRQSFDVVFINSLQIDSPSTSTHDMRHKFENICSPDECKKIIEIATKNDAHNTFVLALAGYIVEAMGPKAIIDAQNSGGYDGIHHTIAIYLRLLSDEYAYLKKDASAKADLEMVLYALALYNHRTNLACTVDHIARIAHLPKERVLKVRDFLVERGLVKPDQGSSKDLRLAHDLLSDHVMRRDENEYLRIDHAVSMQQIVDRRLSSETLIDVQDEKDPFISTIVDGRFPSIAACLLWIAAIFYGIRLAAPQLVLSWLAPFNAILEKYLPGVVNPFGFETWYFFPIAFTQYIWVLFIYGLDRGFFRYVTQLEGRRFMGWIIHLIGPLGAALGFLLSFAPSLFILTIVIPALFLAIAYLLLWGQHKGGRLIGSYFLSLGGATIANMMISLIVCAGLTEILVLRLGSGQDVAGFGYLLLVCAAFLYFAYAMYGLQGSLHGRAAMLTIYDAGRRR